MASMFTGKEAPGMTGGRGPCPHYLNWPLHQPTPQLWFWQDIFLFLFF